MPAVISGLGVGEVLFDCGCASSSAGKRCGERLTEWARTAAAVRCAGVDFLLRRSRKKKSPPFCRFAAFSFFLLAAGLPITTKTDFCRQAFSTAMRTGRKFGGQAAGNN